MSRAPNLVSVIFAVSLLGCSSPAATGSGGASASSASTTATQASSSTWSPPADAGWKRVNDWGCPWEAAVHPEEVASPVSWVPCDDGVPGCERLVVRGDVPNRKFSVGLRGVARAAGDYRIALEYEYEDPSGPTREVLYGPDGKPLAAWRVDEPSCFPFGAAITERAFWLATARDDQSRMRFWYASAPGASPTDMKTTSCGFSSQETHANDDFFTTVELGGNAVGICDRLTGRGVEFGSSQVPIGPAIPAGDAVLLSRARTYYAFEALVWTRGADQPSLLIEPAKPDGSIINLQSDGQTIVWIEAPITGGDFPYGPGDIWTSPMAKTKAAIARTRRAAAPPLAEALVTSAAHGWYSLALRYDDANGSRVVNHIYRLSDMRHWSFQSGDWGTFSVYVDGTYVFLKGAWGYPAAVYRHAISALGPGDP